MKPRVSIEGTHGHGGDGEGFKLDLKNTSGIKGRKRSGVVSNNFMPNKRSRFKDQKDPSSHTFSGQEESISDTRMHQNHLNSFNHLSCKYKKLRGWNHGKMADDGLLTSNRADKTLKGSKKSSKHLKISS